MIFDGSGDYLEITDAYFGTPFTIMMYLYRKSSYSKAIAWFKKGTYFYFLSTTDLQLHINGEYSDFTVSLPLNIWFHLAIT